MAFEIAGESKWFPSCGARRSTPLPYKQPLVMQGILAVVQVHAHSYVHTDT